MASISKPFIATDTCSNAAVFWSIMGGVIWQRNKRARISRNN
jgi:hypothetical protein